MTRGSEVDDDDNDDDDNNDDDDDDDDDDDRARGRGLRGSGQVGPRELTRGLVQERVHGADVEEAAPAGLIRSSLIRVYFTVQSCGVTVRRNRERSRYQTQ